ncbi:MAG: Asp23/Gls24 family envelope stress response protein [Ruthenibacterium sp.]
MHIQVTYGLNIAAIVRSITNKVKYAVEDATALKVLRIDVYVDDIV